MTIGLINWVSKPPTGKVGINGFHSIPNNSYLYKNFAKGISSFAAGTYALAQNLDANGYPTIGTLGSDIPAVFAVPTSYMGNWRIDWLGKCNLNLTTGSTVLSDPNAVTSVLSSGIVFNGGGTASTRTAVDFVFTGAPSSASLKFVNNGNFTGFSDLRIYRTSASYTGDGAALDSGILENAFNDDFVNQLKLINPPYIRCLDIGGINFSYLASSSLSMTVGSLSYVAPYYRPNMWTGSAATVDGISYTCNSGRNGAYVEGETIQLQIQAVSASTTPTLNDNSRGAKTIVFYSTVAFLTGTFGPLPSSTSLGVNTFWTFVYESVTDTFTASSGGQQSHAPLAMRVALCNKLGKDFWWQIPFLYDNTSITAELTYIRDHLRSDLNLYWEYSNEVWNNVFDATNQARVKGGQGGVTGLGFSGSSGQNYHSWYGLRFAQITDLIIPTWTATRSSAQLRGLIMFQNADHASGSPSKTYRLEGANLAAFGYSTASNRPVDKAYGNGHAIYTAGSLIKGGSYSTGYTAGEILAMTNAADNYATGNPSLMSAALDWIQADHKHGLKGGALTGETIDEIIGVNASDINGWNVTYGNPVVLYEGNYEGVAPTTAQCTSAFGIATSYSASIQNLINAYKLDSRFVVNMTYAYDQFFGLSQSKYASCYGFGNGTGQWDTGSGDLYGTNYGSFTALVQYNYKI